MQPLILENLSSANSESDCQLAPTHWVDCIGYRFSVQIRCATTGSFIATVSKRFESELGAVLTALQRYQGTSYSHSLQERAIWTTLIALEPRPANRLWELALLKQLAQDFLAMGTWNLNEIPYRLETWSMTPATPEYMVSTMLATSVFYLESPIVSPRKWEIRTSSTFDQSSFLTSTGHGRARRISKATAKALTKPRQTPITRSETQDPHFTLPMVANLMQETLGILYEYCVMNISFEDQMKTSKIMESHPTLKEIMDHADHHPDVGVRSAMTELLSVMMRG